MNRKVVFALSSFYPEHRAGTETWMNNLDRAIKEIYLISS
jgi:hypothetical protein